MFDRFTAEARSALVLSEAEARAAGADAIRPLHLALGCLSQPGNDAARLLESLNLSAPTIADLIRPLATAAPDQKRLPMTGELKEVLIASLRIAMDTARTMVTSAHLLAAILMADPTGKVASSAPALDSQTVASLAASMTSTEASVG